MFAYWLFFTIIVFLSLLVIFKIKKIETFSLFILAILFLILFCGLRTESNDYDGYKEIFSQVPSFANLNYEWLISKSINVEYGFIILSSFIKLFSSNVVYLMLVVAALSIFLNSHVIWKVSPYVFLSLLLYFSHNFILKETIQIRQGLASAIILYAFYKNNNKLFVVLLVMLAGSIQSSAYLTFVPLYFAYKNITNKQYYLIFIIFIFLTFIYSGRHLFESVLNLFGLPDSISGYLGWEEHDFKIGFFSPILVKQILIFSVLLYFRNQLKDKFVHFNFFFNFYFFSTLWYIYFNDFAIVAGRVSNLFSVGEIILIPMLITVVLPRQRIYLYFSMIVLGAITLFLDLNSGSVFEYKNIFF